MSQLLMRPSPVALLVAAVTLTVAAVAGIVTLSALHMTDTASMLLGFVGPLIAALFVAAKVDATTGAQNATLADHSAQLATISKNTNGVLDARIRDGAREVITDVLAGAGLIPQQATPAATIPAPPAGVPVLDPAP